MERGRRERSSAVFRALPLLLVMTGTLLPARATERADSPEPPRQTLTGDWGKARSWLASRGITIEADYTGEISSNQAGGIRQRSEYLDNTDFIVAIDASKLAGWQGTDFLLYALGNHGGDPTDNVGSLQAVSNIEAHDTWKVYEAWVQHTFEAQRLSILAGLYDLNSEFDVIEAARLFMLSSHGIGPEFAQSGLNGPSIFPTTSAGLRLRARPRDSFYAQAAILDGVPGDPEDSEGTHVQLGGGDGALLAAEIGFLSERAGASAEDSDRRRRRRIGRLVSHGLRDKLAFGAWGYTASFDDVNRTQSTGEPVQRRGTMGAYILAEKLLRPERDAGDQGLMAFVRFGAADADVNRLDRYAGAGLVYRGFIPSRPADEIGLALAWARNGENFRRGAGRPFQMSETAVEITCRTPLTPWLSVQGDMQLIIDPGTRGLLENALVLAFRVEISL